MWKRIVAIGLLCSAAAGVGIGAPADEAAIRANVAAFEAAWNKRDVAGVVATYAPDGDVVVVDGPRVVGHEAIRKSLEDFSTTPPTMRITLRVTGVRLLSHDVAIADTLAHFNEGAVRDNRGTSVFVRREGHWLVAALRVFPAQKP